MAPRRRGTTVGSKVKNGSGGKKVKKSPNTEGRKRVGSGSKGKVATDRVTAFHKLRESRKGWKFGARMGL